MSIRVNDFQWEPGKNDAEYIKLLESSRDDWQKIAQKAIAKLKALSKAQEPIETRLHLCESCMKEYPECDVTDDGIEFGCGAGNDNIIGCTAYMNRWKAQGPAKPYAEYSEHTGTKWLTCGACEQPMIKITPDAVYPNYCPNCGRKVWYE